MDSNGSIEEQVRAQTRSMFKDQGSVNLSYTALRLSLVLLTTSNVFLFVSSLAFMYAVTISVYFIHRNILALNSSLYLAIIFHYFFYRNELQQTEEELEKRDLIRRKLQWRILEILDLLKLIILRWWKG